MTSELIKTYTDGMSEHDWLYWRFTHGIGASDVGCVCGLTQSWKAPIEFYYQMLDFKKMFSEDSIRKELGHEFEEVICRWYRYWPGTVQGMLANKRAGIIVNEVSNVNAFLQNPKYPQLFCSLDRRIHKNGERGEGVLEAKLISGMIAKKYIDSLPPYQLIQVQTQLMITILTYGDLAVMTDAQDYGVYSFVPREDFFHIIDTKTADFWNRVVQARKYVTMKFEAELACNMRLANELQAEIDRLEPNLVGGEAEEMFLREKYKKSIAEIGLIKGTDAQYQVAVKLKGIKADIKKLEDSASICQNELMRAIGSGNALDFGAKGTVKWSGSPKRFYNSIK